MPESLFIMAVKKCYSISQYIFLIVPGSWCSLETLDRILEIRCTSMTRLQFAGQVSHGCQLLEHPCQIKEWENCSALLISLRTRSWIPHVMMGGCGRMFSVHQVYKVLGVDDQQIDTDLGLDYCVIWRFKHPIKIRLFPWLLRRNVLLTTAA